MSIRSLSTSTLTQQTRYKSMACAFASPPYSCQYLVIGGGAGGGAGDGSAGYGGGGGGNGAYRTNVVGDTNGGGQALDSPLSLAAGTYTVTIGAGGTGGASIRAKGNAGSQSVFAGITAGGSSGGGGGGNGAGSGYGSTGNGGGAGGGGGGGNSNAGGGAAGTYGYAGGTAGSTPANGGTGAGGGGAGGAGTYANPGGAGAGLISSIDGLSITRGKGGDGPVTVSYDGPANTGEGGDGGVPGNVPAYELGRAGGSGVVIFTVPKQAIVTFSGGVTYSVASLGVNAVYTVTATSTTSETVTIA